MSEKNMKTTTVCEYVSSDIMEEDFIKMFSNVHKLQMILGTCRVDARDRFITAPTLYQKIHSIIQCLAGITLHTWTALLYLNTFVSEISPNLYTFGVFTLSNVGIMHLGITIHARFLNNIGNVQLFVDMQKIDRLLGIEREEAIHKMTRIANNISIGITLIMLAIIIFLTFHGGVTVTFPYMGLGWMLYGLILEFHQCAVITEYFIIRAILINSILKNFCEGNKDYKKPRYMTRHSESFMKYIASQTRSFEDSHSDLYLRKMFECFDNFQQLYRFPISIYILIAILLLNAAILFTISGVFKASMLSSEKWIILLLIISGCAHTISLSILMENFIREVKEIKHVALAIMSRYHTGPLRKKAKRIAKLIEESSPSFSLYGMYTVDAQFILHISSIATTLIVTILQFAVL